MSAAPKANPPTIRAIYKVSYEMAYAEVIAESAYKNATASNIFFRPIRSLRRPAISIAIIAANEGELTTQPVCASLRSNCGPA